MIVGSTAFFKDIKGFDSQDIDILTLVDKPTGFKNCRQFRFKNKCVFEWRNMPAQEFIDVTLTNNSSIEIGKFLVPEFIDTIGLTMAQLKQLRPLIDKLDDRHLYEKTIYDAYITNNAFKLTNAQLIEAYNEYKKYR